MIRSLMSTALYANDHERPQRALMHYLLAAHAGIEAAQHNAAHLYAHAMPTLRKGKEEGLKDAFYKGFNPRTQQIEARRRSLEHGVQQRLELPTPCCD